MSCTRGGIRFPAYAKCILDCTCDLDVTETGIIDYCNDKFQYNGTANAACMCLNTRCSMACLKSVRCALGATHNDECWMLEESMPGCGLGCEGTRPPFNISNSSKEKLVWDFSKTPCVTDIDGGERPQQVEAKVEKGGSESSVWVSVGIGVGVAIVLICICIGTVFHLRRRRAQWDEEMQVKKTRA
mmetsp:Transcript_44797/g.80564  ORF Transcript_44797/g.80564 Transcript_44797/m.80564 type:complete len:186 (-) Transcript_44797:47-604(-)